MIRGPVVDSETFGRWSEGFARFMGTAWFLVGMTVFVGAWLAWNAFAPADLQFDPRRLNFTLMTLILSLQASYAAPLILLAQNRQADRDRVTAEQDRDRVGPVHAVVGPEQALVVRRVPAEGEVRRRRDGAVRGVLCQGHRFPPSRRVVIGRHWSR